MNQTILDEEEKPLDHFKPKFWWKYYLLIALNTVKAIFLNAFIIMVLLSETGLIQQTSIPVVMDSIFGQFCAFFGALVSSTYNHTDQAVIGIYYFKDVTVLKEKLQEV